MISSTTWISQTRFSSLRPYPYLTFRFSLSCSTTWHCDAVWYKFKTPKPWKWKVESGQWTVDGGQRTAEWVDNEQWKRMHLVSFLISVTLTLWLSDSLTLLLFDLFLSISDRMTMTITMTTGRSCCYYLSLLWLLLLLMIDYLMMIIIIQHFSLDSGSTRSESSLLPLPISQFPSMILVQIQITNDKWRATHCQWDGVQIFIISLPSTPSTASRRLVSEVAEREKREESSEQRARDRDGRRLQTSIVTKPRPRTAYRIHIHTYTDTYIQRTHPAYTYSIQRTAARVQDPAIHTPRIPYLTVPWVTRPLS